MDMKEIEKLDLENKYLRLFYIQAMTGLAFVDVQNVVIDTDIKPYLDNIATTQKYYVRVTEDRIMNEFVKLAS